MYRLVRKFRARVKKQEFILFCITFTLALTVGCGAGKWYREAGRDMTLIAYINVMGGVMDAMPDSGGDVNGAAGQDAYELFAERSDDVANGFYTSPKTGLLQPASGYSASYLSLLGESASVASEGAAPDISGEPYGAEDEPDLHSGAGGAGENAETNAEIMPETNRQADNDSGIIPEMIPEPILYTVKVIYNGDRHVFQTPGKKVSELFDEHGIVLSPEDKMTGAYLDGMINSDLYIEIKRITQKTVVEEIVIPAKTVYRDNAEITDGKSRIIRNGSDGLKRIEYVITYENGIQVSKKVVKEEIVAEAVSGIIEQGSSGTRTGKDGVEFTYTGVIDVKCTAYTSSYEDTGKRPGDPAFGITKSGTVAREGIVAVDPSVIPLGTKMYIDILDDSVEDYGFAIAEDTGGKIKGKKIDLYFDATHDELKQFGVRKAKVYIIE